MQKPVQYHKKQLSAKVESGEILTGREVVETTCSRYKVNKDDHSITETTTTFCARKIELLDIRKKMLSKHEKMGIIRNCSDEYFDSLSDVMVKSRLKELGEVVDPDMSVSDGLNHLKHISRQRFLKVWHDHSTIAGHSHLLVLVSGIYDPAFYLTTEEMLHMTGRSIDVQTVVETPEIHILGRSSSSLCDQRMFLECRKECLVKLTDQLTTSAGVEFHDVMRFFHGDGPAQQFEAGHTIGGNYCCVGCGVKSNRMDDIAYSYRCTKMSLQDRQDFILQGEAWKKGGSNLFDRLRVAELHKELDKRGIDTSGKLKPALEIAFVALKMGISNFPAMLQKNPEESLESIGLKDYEVSPCEPLHDLKGHFTNLIEETLNVITGTVLNGIKKIKQTVLNKETLRGSDYRKAIILLYLKLKELGVDQQLVLIYSTAVQIYEILYARHERRTPRAILCLHNCTFLHAYLCSKVFPFPRSVTRRKMFGRYFHSIATHSALVYRVICLRSLNTEQEERMFGQSKAITKATSNNHPQHVVTNILQRLQVEAQVHSTDSVGEQESEIKALAQAVGTMPNSHIRSCHAGSFQSLSGTPTTHQ